MTNTDPIETARSIYARRVEAAETALQARLAILAEDNPEARRDINSPEMLAAFAPLYAVRKAAQADYQAATLPVIRALNLTA